jgi:hypothetical protein
MIRRAVTMRCACGRAATRAALAIDVAHRDLLANTMTDFVFLFLYVLAAPSPRRRLSIVARAATRGDGC